MRGSADRVDAAEYGDRIAAVYDAWHGPVRDSDADAEVAFLEARAGGGPALELGVGTGRVALALAARGIAVVGIDSSQRMVDRMRAKPGGRDIDVTIGDFADVEAPGGPFALVYVVFNTFFVLLSQADQVRCVTNVARVLRPGGAFVMEAFVPDPTLYDRDQRVEVVDIAGQALRLAVAKHDRATQRVSSRHVAVVDGVVDVYPTELRYAWPAELDLMAELAGLSLAERDGGWAREPFASASSKHVSVWRKPNR